MGEPFQSLGRGVSRTDPCENFWKVKVGVFQDRGIKLSPRYLSISRRFLVVPRIGGTK